MQLYGLTRPVATAVPMVSSWLYDDVFEETDVTVTQLIWPWNPRRHPFSPRGCAPVEVRLTVRHCTNNQRVWLEMRNQDEQYSKT